MKHLTKERICQQNVMHYKILLEVCSKELTAVESEIATRIINAAIKATEDEAKNLVPSQRFYVGKPEIVGFRQEYLEKLLKKDTKGAIDG